MISTKFTLAQCDSVICNMTLTGDFGNYGGNAWDQFNDGLVPCWWRFSGSPQLYRTYTSAPSAAAFWSERVSWGVGGESIFQWVDIKAGEQYAFGMSTRLMPNTNGNGLVRAYLRQSYSPYGTQNVRQVWLTRFNNHFITKTTCFTANNDYDQLILASTPANQYVMWAVVDDVELYHIEARAGDDTAFCDTTVCVTLGEDCDVSLINLDRTINWYEEGNPVPFAHSIEVEVCPDVTTTYIQEVNYEGCSDFDSVTIYVEAIDSFDLGPNDSFCEPSCDTIGVPYDSGQTYWWSTGDTTNSIVVCESGWYYLTITYPYGCTYTDSIKLTFLPVFHVSPMDTMICPATAFPITLSVDSLLDSYLWSTGDTTQSVVINAPGTYWVVGGDTLCSQKAWVQVNTIDDFLYIGNNRSICEGSSVQICDTNIYIKGEIHYRWNTGDTTRCITVSQAGTYTLVGWLNTDTLCADTVSVNVDVIDLPEISCPLFGPYCENDPPVLLTGCTPDSNLSYSGPGVKNNTFYPEYARAGTHTIAVTYTTNTIPACFSYYSFQITVKPLPNVEIEPVDPLCLNDAPIYLQAHPGSGTWGGVLSDSLFDPAVHGVGEHLVRYAYTDTNGCSDSFDLYVTVFDTFDVWISKSLPAFCENSSIDLVAKTSKSGTYKYYWSTGDTTKRIRVSESGTYSVSVYDSLLLCSDTAEITVEYEDCCSLYPEGPLPFIDEEYTLHSGETDDFANDTLFVDHDIVIESGASLSIRNCRMYMRNCSRIIVQNGAYCYVNNSVIGLCKWRGFEVWGQFDACPYDTTKQGKLEIHNSTISEADIGILVGRTVDSIPYYAPEFNGGMIRVVNNSFENNYIHIMIEDWNIGGICACGEQTEHQIHYNEFGILKSSDDEVCETAAYAIYRINWVMDNATEWPNRTPKVSMLSSRCHIVDFSAYLGYSANYWGGYFPCEVSIFTNNNPELHPLYDPLQNQSLFINATEGNTYETGCYPCGCMSTEPYQTFLK